MKLYIPKWFYQNNMGDSLCSTFIPKVLKKKYPEESIELITYGFLLEIFHHDPNVGILRGPTPEEILTPAKYMDVAFNNPSETVKAIYPEMHPRLYEFWGKHHDFLVNHPTANIITVNFALQLGVEDMLFDGTDFKPDVHFDVGKKNPYEPITVGIVPASKLAGRPTPHPGCNGIGLRYKHWDKYVAELRAMLPNIRILEFSETDLGLGDERIPYQDSIIDLIKIVNTVDIGVLSDGGLHWIFNILEKPTVLFTGTLVNKAEFFKVKNSNYPEHLHLDCRKSCRSYFTEVFGGEDKSKICNLECEDLDPSRLAEYTREIIDEKF